MPAAPRTPVIPACLFALALLAGCAKQAATSPAAIEPAPSSERAGFVAQLVNQTGRSATGVQGSRRARPPARSHRDRSTGPDRPGSPSAPSPSVDPFAEAFVEAHNLHRARVSPAASPPLPGVRWSDELAARAQAWADRCEFEHSRGDFGENLAARTNMAAPEDIVASWAGEADDFDYAGNRCAGGRVCGHYTQIVWRDSTQIGCGVAQCGSGGPFGGGAWTNWVCNYSPAGNWMGERPY